VGNSWGTALDPQLHPTRVHPDVLRIGQEACQGLGFYRRQLLQPRHGDLAAIALFAEQPIEAEVLQTRWYDWGQKSAGNNWGTR